VAQKNSKLIIDEQSKEYWKWRDSILAYEELMLETLTFDLMVDNPYMRLHDYMGQLDLLHNKALRDAAWAFCNDSCLTVLPLLLNARDVAIAAVFFATSVTREKIDDVNGEPWWRFLKGSEMHTIRAVQLMTDFYKENPLRKQDSKVPGSPEFNLESTRRRGELSLSHMDLDSSQYGTPTPLGSTDRGATQSPRPGGGGGAARLNGKAEFRDSSDSKEVAIKIEEPSDSSATKIGDEEVRAAVEGGGSSSGADADISNNRGDSDAALKVAANDLSTHEASSSTLNGSTRGGLVSPQIKRRSEDPEGWEERDVKRQRLDDEDEDEGEIKGS
jgi:hypothetical protein